MQVKRLRRRGNVALRLMKPPQYNTGEMFKAELMVADGETKVPSGRNVHHNRDGIIFDIGFWLNRVDFL